jgi:alpha-1,3-glucan synthase
VLIRKGEANNVMVFPENEYDTDSSFGFSNGQYTFAHKAYGADMFRYSWNFGQNWTQWANWEDTTIISKDVFANSANFWDGDHIMVQCQFTPPLCLELAH